AARTTTALSALASRSTAVLARSLSVQTCAAVNATNRPKIMPNGGSMPGEMALNARPRSPSERAVTSRVDSRRHQIREAENDQRHPNNWQIVQPVVHVKVPLCQSQEIKPPTNNPSIVDRTLNVVVRRLMARQPLSECARAAQHFTD